VIIGKLLSLYTSIWSNGTVPQEFKDARIVHIFKRKGDRSVCDDHRGVSLLSIPGKILARIILIRLVQHVNDHNILPESQCGFRGSRSTMDMIFTARQLQVKCCQAIRSDRQPEEDRSYAPVVSTTEISSSLRHSWGGCCSPVGRQVLLSRQLHVQHRHRR